MRPFLFIIVLLAFASFSYAQNVYWSASAGYSNAYFSHPTSGYQYERDGGYLDGDVMFALPRRFPILLGAGFDGAFHYQSEDYYHYDYYSYYHDHGQSTDVGLFSFEARAALPLQFPQVPRFFLVPKIGAGLLVDSYAIDLPFDTEYHDGVAFGIRPIIQAGYAWDVVAVGAEVSYQIGWGDFGHLGNQSRDLHAGVFVVVRY